jgi:3-hydroxyisobutyrate dehydrogenase-like beta-hydroxyacid dehydrogenase
MSQNRKVGFAGLGRMGRPMASNLVASGFDVVVHNRTLSKAEDFAGETGAAVAATPRELAEGCEVVITMLADGPALVAAYEGDDGMVAGMGPGSVGVDMGTSGPGDVTRVRTMVEGAGARLVDAPVSGSTPAAEAGTLLVMVGGSAEDYAIVEPILAAVGNPEHVGPAGSAATLKLAVNSILYGVNEALAEAVILSERSGVDPEKVLDIVSRSAAGAPMVAYRMPQYLDPDHNPITFTMDLAAKDLRLTLDHAADLGLTMPQAERTLDTVEALIDAGYGDRDLGFVIEGARRAQQGGS